IDGLDNNLELVTLNLSNNSIKTVAGLDHLPKLSTLNLSKNEISSLEDLEHLRGCASITNLDLQDNRIEDEGVIELLNSMPKLTTLYLKGNPVVRKIRHYRKSVLSQMPRLGYLDDRPVFGLERKEVEAWVTGGARAQRNVRERDRAEKAAKSKQHLQAFREWQTRKREERLAELKRLQEEAEK
ncbi:ODA7, partial [Symbiodinium sp. KB8]